MNEIDSKRVYKSLIYPRGSKIISDKGFTNKNYGSQEGTHWVCFIVKDNKPYYFDLFGVNPDNLLLNQKPKPKIYRNYK